MEVRAVIRINFDPKELEKTSSTLFGVNDFKDLVGLLAKLRAAQDPVSKCLRVRLSQGTQQQLDAYDGSTPPDAVLQDALVQDLNQLLSSPGLYDKKRFTGVKWGREILMKALIKSQPQGDGLFCFNRLVIEEFYVEEIKKSQKAEWDAWNLLAATATQSVIDKWEEWKVEWDEWKKKPQEEKAKPEAHPPEFKPDWDDDVWKGFRDWLSDNIFHGKCAYCETHIEGFLGDAEHFRPKGRVSVKSEDGDTKIIMVVDENNEEIAHPGYFWLAYNWKNLLPSCELCNRYGGKKDLFPAKSHVVAKQISIGEIDKLLYQITKSKKFQDTFYLEPEDLDVLEERLLLHPLYDDPKKHLYFKVTGEAAARQGDDKAEESIRVYDLNYKTKVKWRNMEQQDGLKNYFIKLAAAKLDLNALQKAASDLREEYHGGARPYAAAVFDFLHDKFEGTDFDPEILLGEAPQNKPEDAVRP
jgi:hypothetical protein